MFSLSPLPYITEVRRHIVVKMCLTDCPHTSYIVRIARPSLWNVYYTVLFKNCIKVVCT